MSGTLHRRVERALSAVSSLGATVASRASAGELLEAVVKSAKEILGGDLAAVALYDREQLAVQACIGPALAKGTALDKDGVLAKVAKSRRACVIHDDPECGATRAVVCPLGSMGVVFVGQTRARSKPDDAADMTILSLFAEQAAAVLRSGKAIEEERSFSSKLLRLGGYVARAGAGWAPEGIEELLREIAMAVGAEAAAVAEATEDGTYRMRDAWNLPPETVASWAMSVSSAREISFSAVAAASESGLSAFTSDLVVLIPRSGPQTRLHLLTRTARQPFAASDVRLVEVIAVHIGALLDRLQMMREMQAATQAERHASLRLRDLYDDIGEGIVVLDGEGKVSFASRRTFHILHAAPNQILGRTLFEDLTFDDRMPIVHAFLKAAAGSRARAEVRVTTPGGGRAVELSARPDDRSDPTRAVRMVLRDVTDERRRESDTLHREKLASVGELAAGVAHEINNPISFVLSNARWLAGKIKDLDEAFAYYRIVCDSPAARTMESRLGVAETMKELPQVVTDSLDGLERVRRIVSDMRMISRKDPEEATNVDLAAVVESTLAMCAPMLRMRAVVEKEISELPTLSGWPGRLSQALLNLLVNAAQAIPEGKAHQNRVTVRGWSDGEWIHVSVTDTGKGIPPEHRSRLFTPFFTTKPPGEGTGLGLALSYEAVRRHGGRIVVESEVGKGTTFTILLPVAGADAPSPSAPIGGEGDKLRLAV